MDILLSIILISLVLIFILSAIIMNKFKHNLLTKNTGLFLALSVSLGVLLVSVILKLAFMHP